MGDVLTGMDARLERTSRELDAFLDHVIDDHLLSPKANGCDGAMEQEDLVDVLLQVQKDSTLDIPLTRNNLKAIIMVG